MKRSELEALVAGITPPLLRYIDERFAKMEGRLAEQRERLAQLEQRGNDHETV